MTISAPYDPLSETLEILTLARDASIDVDEALVEAGARPPGPMLVVMPAELLDVLIVGLQEARRERAAAMAHRERWRRGQRLAWVAAAAAFILVAVW